MIEIKNLTHDYYRYRALHDINLGFKKNEITALVGPNGAGKTTLIKCLVGLMKPTEGTVLIDGIDVYEQPRLAHTKIGYLPDFFGLYDSLTVKQHLQYAAESHEIAAEMIPAAIQTTVDQIGLLDKLHVKSSALSRGMKQRLAIGQTIISKPDYLVLDEPASGLDPEARLSLSKLFINLKNDGMSLIISSHILAELEEYATELVVIREGKLFSESDLNKVNYSDAANMVNVFIDAIDDKAQLIAAIKAYDESLVLAEEKRGIKLQFTDDKDAQVNLLKHLIERKIKVFKFEAQEKRMQDKYFDSIEKK